MDVDTAWDNFKKSNKTSVEDKLDVILAQQQEILTDTSRTADLVPLVTGDRAEEDALEESGALEGEEDMGIESDEGMPEIAPDESLDESEESEEDNPFSFLDEDSTEESEPDEESDREYEETDEDSDIYTEEEDTEESDEESPVEETDAGDETEESEESDDTEETDDTDEESAEEESEDTEESDEPEDEEDYISFDEIDDEDEDDEEETKKSAPVTKTIKSYASKVPMTVVKATSAPSPSLSYGRASTAEEISNMLFKSNDDDFDIGFGIDPHKVVEKDWAEYRMMKKLNTF